ncbi:hypothetical protein Tco_0782045 [Tanacetum coccineum]
MVRVVVSCGDDDNGVVVLVEMMTRSIVGCASVRGGRPKVAVAGIRPESGRKEGEALENIGEERGVSLIGMDISTHLLLNRRQASVANLNKNIDADDLLVSGYLSTPRNPNTKHENEDLVLSQVGVDIVSPSVAEDAKAHTSMEMKGGSEDGLMPDDTKLTTVGGSSADYRLE